MVTIKVRENGPYRVDGDENDVQLVDWNGQEYTIAKRPFALCRCGGSTTKPFCDGTHSKIGFKAAESAPFDRAQGAPTPRRCSGCLSEVEGSQGRGAVPGSQDRPAE